MKIKNRINESEFENKKLKEYIINKLLPALKEYGIDMKAKTRESSTQLNYIGFFMKSKTYVGLNFSTTSQFMDNSGKIFCTVVLGGRSVKAGTLTGIYVDHDMEMIARAIEEDLGFDYENIEGCGA